MNFENDIIDTIGTMTFISKDEIRLDDKLVSLGIDSLMMVELIILLEDTFGITFDDSDLAPALLEKICDIVELTEKYISAKG